MESVLIVISILLIAIVLLQSGKAESAGNIMTIKANILLPVFLTGFKSTFLKGLLSQIGHFLFLLNFSKEVKTVWFSGH